VWVQEACAGHPWSDRKRQRSGRGGEGYLEALETETSSGGKREGPGAEPHSLRRVRRCTSPRETIEADERRIAPSPVHATNANWYQGESSKEGSNDGGKDGEPT
jgi:hypothetical protein